MGKQTEKGMVIGIDVGISTTKIVGLTADGNIISPIRIKATDPVTSLYGAFGKYLYDNDIELNDVRQVMLTGVGSAYVETPVYGLPTAKAAEFLAEANSALREAADALRAVSDGLDRGIPSDLLAEDLRAALAALGSITGLITTDEVLGEIFSKFCIGK